MIRILLILVALIQPNIVFAFSMPTVNPAAVNMIKYQQQNASPYRRSQVKHTPYVYSEQQAKYYGLRTQPYQYNQYGIYQQNYLIKKSCQITHGNIK